VQKLVGRISPRHRAFEERRLCAGAGPPQAPVLFGAVAINEWAVAAEIKSSWDSVIASDLAMRGLNTRVEDQSEAAGQKRSDLTLRRAADTLAVGELRLPDHHLADPWLPENIKNARDKALAAGANWAFTSDCNTFLLIDVHAAGEGPSLVVAIKEIGHHADREEIDRRLDDVKAEWRDLLLEMLPTFLGIAVPVRLPDDERFIRLLRGSLRRPIREMADSLDRKRSTDTAFASALIQWMVADQGWPHDQTKWAEEVQRTASLSAYVFTTRLLFYEALRRAEPELSPLSIAHGTPAVAARGAVSGYFQDARNKSRDYETLFVWDRACEYALIDDSVVEGWCRLIDQLNEFDLTKMDYDVVGRIFERLIEPYERYRYGQHYTVPDIVDLMLSFAIPDGEGALADMASGGGTFLVRAYARKRALQPSATHQQLLAEIYGNDISEFAASLATLNLAIRDLSFTANYPRVARRSFFSVEPGQPFMTIPDPNGEPEDVTLPSLRAFVCNPPYVRVQEIPPSLRLEATAILGQMAPGPPIPTGVNRNANYHLYFWFHGAQFLSDDGYLVFITSTEWMDSDYGAALQEWLLRHFKLIAVVDSFAEPWFSEARVKTAVTIAKRCPDREEREANTVRFVRLRRPLISLYGSHSDPVEHFASVDALRDRILGLEGTRGSCSDLQWRTISQRELWKLGLRN
jgi:methylase of polypeptide subunit release factors